MPETPSKPTADWERRERPPALFRRFQFADYGATRAFLDALAELSKQDGYYPDLGFGANYANVTIHARDGTGLQQKDFEFAARINEIIDPAHGVKP